MDQPAEEEEPQHGRETELKDCHEETTLEQLPEPGNKEAAQRGDDISSRALTRHDDPPKRNG